MTVVKSNYAPKANQFYETPTWAVEALLRVVEPKGELWEPSAGNHRISDVLKQKTQCTNVVTSDIVEYEKHHDFIYDFINGSMFRDKANWIITNPPYGAGNRLAVRYAQLALERADNVALLLTAKFDFGKTRQNLFRNNPRFYGKINLMDRLSFFDNKTGTEDHAWYIWTKESNEFPRLFYEKMKS